jgi:hypothetical protein
VGNTGYQAVKKPKNSSDIINTERQSLSGANTDRKMYEIRRTDYGLHIVIGGVYAKGEIAAYIAEKEKIASDIQGPYSMLVDLRTAIPPSQDDAKLLQESQARQKDNNLRRMAIIVISPVLKECARQVSFLSGMADSTRIFNATTAPNWEQLALNWILQGEDSVQDQRESRRVSHPG